MTMEDLTELWHRVRQANKVIAAIAAHGRRFFYSPSFDRTSKFGLDRYGQVWYVDHYTGMKLHPFGDQAWPGFTNGGTLRRLIADLAQYIVDGKPLPVTRFFTHWAYDDEAVAAVRAEILETEAVTEK